MDEHRSGRRDFLKRMTALAAAGVPLVAGLRPGPARHERGRNPE